MKTPKDRYQNDAEYKAIVDLLEIFIHRCRYSPSEMREAAVLASINYEMHRTDISETMPITTDIENALKTICKYVNSETPRPHEER